MPGCTNVGLLRHGYFCDAHRAAAHQLPAEKIEELRTLARHNRRIARLRQGKRKAASGT
jgi:hypothetical protein